MAIHRYNAVQMLSEVGNKLRASESSASTPKVKHELELKRRQDFESPKFRVIGLSILNSSH